MTGLCYCVLMRVWPTLYPESPPDPFRPLAACASVELARGVVDSHPAKRALEWEIRFRGELLESGSPEYLDRGVGI